ncbi:uncharacterized protein [Rhodnius prolixus]|uniref:uncharacterized protein n=1 Tax=Rhodnius prolixus TaxID=13249 RepID=UPI003D18B4D4
MTSVWTNERTLRLIEAIRKRRALWDRRHSQHHSQPALKKHREDVVAEVGEIDYAQVKRKWKTLRDTFRDVRRKQLEAAEKNEEYRITWAYYKKLEFLNDQFEDEDTQDANCVLSPGGMYFYTDQNSEVPETVSAQTAVERLPFEINVELEESSLIEAGQNGASTSDINLTIREKNGLVEQSETENISQANEVLSPGGMHFSIGPISEVPVAASAQTAEESALETNLQSEKVSRIETAINRALSSNKNLTLVKKIDSIKLISKLPQGIARKGPDTGSTRTLEGSPSLITDEQNNDSLLESGQNTNNSDRISEENNVSEKLFESEDNYSDRTPGGNSFCVAETSEVPKGMTSKRPRTKLTRKGKKIVSKKRKISKYLDIKEDLTLGTKHVKFISAFCQRMPKYQCLYTQLHIFCAATFYILKRHENGSTGNKQKYLIQLQKKYKYGAVNNKLKYLRQFLKKYENESAKNKLKYLRQLLSFKINKKHQASTAEPESNQQQSSEKKCSDELQISFVQYISALVQQLPPNQRPLIQMEILISAQNNIQRKNNKNLAESGSSSQSNWYVQEGQNHNSNTHQVSTEPHTNESPSNHQQSNEDQSSDELQVRFEQYLSRLTQNLNLNLALYLQFHSLCIARKAISKRFPIRSKQNLEEWENLLIFDSFIPEQPLSPNLHENQMINEQRTYELQQSNNDQCSNDIHLKFEKHLLSLSQTLPLKECLKMQTDSLFLAKKFFSEKYEEQSNSNLNGTNQPASNYQQVTTSTALNNSIPAGSHQQSMTATTQNTQQSMLTTPHNTQHLIHYQPTALPTTNNTQQLIHYQPTALPTPNNTQQLIHYQPTALPTPNITQQLIHSQPFALSTPNNTQQPNYYQPPALPTPNNTQITPNNLQPSTSASSNNAHPVSHHNVQQSTPSPFNNIEDAFTFVRSLNLPNGPNYLDFEQEFDFTN